MMNKTFIKAIIISVCLFPVFIGLLVADETTTVSPSDQCEEDGQIICFDRCSYGRCYFTDDTWEVLTAGDCDSNQECVGGDGCVEGNVEASCNTTTDASSSSSTSTEASPSSSTSTEASPSSSTTTDATSSSSTPIDASSSSSTSTETSPSSSPSIDASSSLSTTIDASSSSSTSTDSISSSSTSTESSSSSSTSTYSSSSSISTDSSSSSFPSTDLITEDCPPCLYKPDEDSSTCNGYIYCENGVNVQSYCDDGYCFYEPWCICRVQRQNTFTEWLRSAFGWDHL